MFGSKSRKQKETYTNKPERQKRKNKNRAFNLESFIQGIPKACSVNSGQHINPERQKRKGMMATLGVSNKRLKALIKKDRKWIRDKKAA